MLGFWGPTTLYGKDPHPAHFALAVSLPELLAPGPRLNQLGIATRDFAGTETTEPSVIGWMPSAQLYFRDPDSHLVNSSPCWMSRPLPASSVRCRNGERAAESSALHSDARGKAK